MALRIAVLPGDGIGPEVTQGRAGRPPRGLRPRRDRRRGDRAPDRRSRAPRDRLAAPGRDARRLPRRRRRLPRRRRRPGVRRRAAGEKARDRPPPPPQVARRLRERPPREGRPGPRGRRAAEARDRRGPRPRRLPRADGRPLLRRAALPRPRRRPRRQHAPLHARGGRADRRARLPRRRGAPRPRHLGRQGERPRDVGPLAPRRRRGRRPPPRGPPRAPVRRLLRDGARPDALPLRRPPHREPLRRHPLRPRRSPRRLARAPPLREPRAPAPASSSRSTARPRPSPGRTSRTRSARSSRWRCSCATAAPSPAPPPRSRRPSERVLATGLRTVGPGLPRRALRVLLGLRDGRRRLGRERPRVGRRTAFAPDGAAGCDSKARGGFLDRTSPKTSPAKLLRSPCSNFGRLAQLSYGNRCSVQHRFSRSLIRAKTTYRGQARVAARATWRTPATPDPAKLILSGGKEAGSVTFELRHGFDEVVGRNS